MAAHAENEGLYITYAISIRRIFIFIFKIQLYSACALWAWRLDWEDVSFSLPTLEKPTSGSAPIRIRGFGNESRTTAVSVKGDENFN